MTGPDYPRVHGDLVTRAVFNALADGAWHDRRDVVAAVAPLVPPEKAYRWRLRTTDPDPVGIARTLKIASGQRDIAANRVMIHTRRIGNIEVDPNDKNRIRLTPAVAAGWRTYLTGRTSAVTS